MLGIRLSTGIEERLDAPAKTTGRSKTYFAHEAIPEYLDDVS
jgi:RHH-type rel operon transcriptional repressor/antitoxin RelB